MGIRLDWEVESTQVEKKQGEDEAVAQRRRVVALRVILIIGVVLGVVFGLIALLNSRLAQVNSQIEQLLRNTVDSEVAALRIGDRDTYMSIQRSATTDWIFAQQQQFDTYETMKVQNDLQLTGRIVDLEIANQRGRAHVEEIIDGVPYTQLWFYWRYEDGWHHVPPDYTFWGEARMLEGATYTIRYQAVDELFAQQLEQKLESWLQTTCTGVLNCGELPHLTVDIVVSGQEIAQWTNDWHLLVKSPLVERARSDLPFDTEYQIAIGSLLSERLVSHVTGGMQPIYPNDVFYLRSAVVSWLVGRFVEIDTNSFLIDSLARNFGDAAVGQLVSLLQPTSNMSVIGLAMNVPIGQANLDWRDFITWRLVTEDELIARQDETNWLNLYDTRDENVRLTAYSRYNSGISSEPKVAILSEPQTAVDGSPQLRVTMRVGQDGAQRDEIALFNLVDNVWKRAS